MDAKAESDIKLHLANLDEDVFLTIETDVIWKIIGHALCEDCIYRIDLYRRWQRDGSIVKSNIFLCASRSSAACASFSS